MKRLISILLILCLMAPLGIVAEENHKSTIYIFGDDWAAEWGKTLSGFVTDPSRFVNAAQNGDLISNLEKKAEWSNVQKPDVVILSYGIMEKDRASDKNADFKKILEKTVSELKNKGVTVIFASICSTVRFNTLTGQMPETKNFYTETSRALAKKEGLTYIDLALLTAQWATKIGSGEASRVYKSNLALTENANRMCAYKVFEELARIQNVRDVLKINLKQVQSVQNGERFKVFDVFFEDELCEEFAVFVKGGIGVSINGAPIADGDTKTVCASLNGKIRVDFSYCEKIQVTPVYKFHAAGFATTSETYKGEVFPGVYDVTVKKSEPLKASVFLNGYMIAANLDMPGTQRVPEAAEHTFKRYHLPEGKFEVHVKGLTDKLEYIHFNEECEIYGDRLRIFVGGDSTVCNYYPLERTLNEPDGTVMTGWAMFLERYVDAHVINLAQSGDWAANWLETSFPIVEKEGEKGDLFVVQFGINDHDKSTVELMTAALDEMIERCAAKGIIPVLVSPQISAGYGWGDESDIGKSDGGAYQEFFDAVRNLAAEKGCFYVDLTDLSSGWFSEIGRENVYRKYHLWDYENNKPKDMMHLSSKGADAMCSFFALGLKKIYDAKQTDKWGNSLEMLKFL